MEIGDVCDAQTRKPRRQVVNRDCYLSKDNQWFLHFWGNPVPLTEPRTSMLSAKSAPASTARPGPVGDAYDYPLGLELLYYDDGGAPFGLLPVWYDYRNDATTGTDIYYEIVDDAGGY